MKNYLYILLVVCLCGFASACSDEPNDDNNKSSIIVEDQGEIAYKSSLGLTANEANILECSNSFAWKFLAKCHDYKSGNIVVSPLSVSITMTMLANGTYDNSPVREEILNVLGYSDFPISEVNSAVMKLADGIYRLDEPVQLCLANSLWVDPLRILLNPEYKELIKNSFFADSYVIDYASYITDVNYWAEVKTKGMIKDFLKKDAKIPEMALLNATYFKGSWNASYIFNQENTKTDNFTNSDNSVSRTEFMQKEEAYETIKFDDLEVVTIPFGNKKYQFHLIRPNDNISIDECLKSLNNGKWDEIIVSPTTKEYLSLKLPKFEIDFSSDIKSILSDLGMVKAMSQPDFFFASPKGLITEKVIHQSRFHINEDGAEAAAITEYIPKATQSLTSTDMKPRPFNLDHPFIYLITEKSSGVIIFAGCVNKL